MSGSGTLLASSRSPHLEELALVGVGLPDVLRPGERVDSLEQVTQPLGVVGEEPGCQGNGDGLPDDRERHRSVRWRC
jgi:hypothetical protein